LRIESFSEERMGAPLRSLHLLYHEVREGGSDYCYVIDSEEFKRHVDLFVRLREANSFSLWPEITFDDGHFSDFEWALPTLQSRGLSARFFITVGWTGKKPGYMGWRELRLLHECGQSIGAHGWSHTLLTNCAQKDLDRELSGARLTLEDKLGTPVTTMSLPGGRYDQRVLAACRRAGYSRIYTSVPRSEPAPFGFMVGRLNIRADMKLDWIRSVLQPGSRALSSLERQYRLRSTAKGLLGDSLYGRIWALLMGKEPDGRNDGGSTE
jgi:hypothetical protein